MIFRFTPSIETSGNRWIGATLFGLVALALAGCETTTSSGAVGVNRSQLMLISAEQLDQMAAETYHRRTTRRRATEPRPCDDEASARSRRIEPQTKVFRPTRQLGGRTPLSEQRAERVLHAGRAHPFY
jgi:hypothetical protein